VDVVTTTPPRRSTSTAQRWRLLATLPPAAIAAFVSVACVLFALFLAGLIGAVLAGVAAVAGAVWGAALVLSLPPRYRADQRR
jgi:hypothetical protein